MIEVGETAPAFTLSAHDGRRWTLRHPPGHPVVLYFYPADGSPTCTAQACDLRARWRPIAARGAELIGISPDPVETHREFRRQLRLPFPLLADPDHRVSLAYGVWGEKQLYGRRYVGMHRTTYVIGPDGIVTHRFDRVRARGHGDGILRVLGG